MRATGDYGNASNPLDQWAPCGVLREIVSRRSLVLPNGEERRLGANISSKASRALYETVLRERPTLVVEVGMAQGVSTLSILCALQQTGGRLISIDPYEDWESGRLAALENVRRGGYAHLHRHIQARSADALPTLLREGSVPQMGYVDGAHDFSNVFLDYIHLDKLLSKGGVIGFNDTGWKDVYRVVRLLKARPDYVELDVGLLPNYQGRNFAVTVMRRVLNWPRNDRYFRKVL